MADVEGVNVRITGDSSQAVNSVDDLMQALRRLRQERNSVAADAARPIEFNVSRMQLPARVGAGLGQQIANGLTQAEAALNDFGTRLQATFGGIFHTIRNGLMAVVGTAGVVGMEFRRALAIGGGFESTMTSVQVVSSATASQMEQLTAKAREMGATLPITAQQAGQAMLIMAQRGTSFADILTSVEDVANLSIFQGTDMQTAASLLGSTMSQFSLATEEASRIVDVFNNACNQSPLNMQHLVDAMQYVGPVAGGMGVKLEEVVAGLEALHKSGLVGSMAGTGLRMVFQKLAAKAQIAGVETKNLDGSSRSLAEIFGELKEKGYSVGQATKDFGARGANAAISLMKLSGELKILEQGLSQVGTTSSGVQEKMKSWPNVWNTFKSASEELHIEIFDQIKEQSKEAVSGISNLVRAFSEWINETGVAQKIFSSFLHGLNFNLPSADEFSQFLNSLNIEDFMIMARNLGETVRNIAESIITFFENVRAPLMFLINNLGTFATISFWGWILGSGMRIAAIILHLGNAVGHLFGMLRNLTTIGNLTGITGGLASLLGVGGAAVASITGIGLGLAAGGAAIYAGYRYSQNRREERRLEAERRKAEAEMKKADREVRQTITQTPFKTGFEDLPEAYKKSSGELKSEIQEDVFFLQESFKDKIADVFSDINIEKIKEKFSGDNVKINFDNYKMAAADVSDEIAKQMSKALQGDSKAFGSLDADTKEAVARLHEMGIEAGGASLKINELVKSYRQLQAEKNPPQVDILTKMQQMAESVSDVVGAVIQEFPEKIKELTSSLGNDKVGLAVELQLEDAKKSLEAFIKATSKESGISEGVISEAVFTQLKELARQGNATAQSLANIWKDSGKSFDDFMQKARDYVEYLNVDPEKFTPALEKMAKGLQKIDPLTGKITEGFKKAHNALKEWANVTFDKVAQKIQRLRKAVEGGFIDKKALENEFKDASEKLKIQIAAEYAPTKGQYQSQEAYRSVLASEYISRLQDLGGETFVEMARKQFSNLSGNIGSAIGAMVERATRTSYLQQEQKVFVNGREIQQNLQGFNMQNFTQALSPVVSGIQQLATQKQQTTPSVDYSSYIASILAELKNTNVSVQNVKVAVDNLSSNFTTIGEAIKNSSSSNGGNTYNVEINQSGFSIQRKSDADNVARLTESAIRQGLGNGGL